MAAHNSPLPADLASLSHEWRSWFFHYAAEFRMEARILIYGVQLLLGLLVDPLPPFPSANVTHAAPSCLRFRPTQAATPHQIEPTMCKNLVYVKSWTAGAVVTDADGAVMVTFAPGYMLKLDVLIAQSQLLCLLDDSVRESKVTNTDVEWLQAVVAFVEESATYVHLQRALAACRAVWTNDHGGCSIANFDIPRLPQRLSSSFVPSPRDAALFSECYVADVDSREGGGRGLQPVPNVLEHLEPLERGVECVAERDSERLVDCSGGDVALVENENDDEAELLTEVLLADSLLGDHRPIGRSYSSRLTHEAMRGNRWFNSRTEEEQEAKLKEVHARISKELQTRLNVGLWLGTLWRPNKSGP
ncbi:hypothetical protein M427DRAFT_32220 [Gonapodya prolifera JEL478]|uniref:Uncharacterized protein n=1 Tax=Gonapodya prolifera (strain JEL478) TaxID=1344416 RepID=A0A139AFE3_GONPJ|nr:hypothetical protein M427DRAFT_32220 [Gonapodya prolifera JEL478]|eukprot:KXS15526.1 hypothetical protein M427DRAFT_32220 [Gonapodya prolifera JEL478]